MNVYNVRKTKKKKMHREINFQERNVHLKKEKDKRGVLTMSNNVNPNNKLYEFAERINNELIALMNIYDEKTPDSERQLQKIKLRIDILAPIQDIQFKAQQLAIAQQMQQGDFMKNFNLKDLIGALKG